MNLTKIFFSTLFLTCALASHGQAWKDSYEKALAAAQAGDWAAAKTSFAASIAVRPEDQSNATTLPGPVTEPVKWRNGSPYSPNFGSAYCSFRLATEAKDDRKNEYLKEASTGFETLIAKGQLSAATLYFLNQSYGMLGMPDKQRELEPKIAASGTWQVDLAFVKPEEVALFANQKVNAGGANNPTKAGAGSNANVTFVKAGSENNAAPTTSLAGRVPVLQNKFALLLGNSQTQMKEGAPEFAASDALAIQESLVQNAGYDDKNVDVVTNATADQMLKAAEALASRIPNEATVVLYFTGIGVNIDGRDYLAGIDAAMTSDTTKMVAKEDLLKAFRAKGAKVFFFCQASRPIKDGRYFGMETPFIGRMSLGQATSPGGEIFGTVSNNKVMGIYTKAFVDTLAQFRSNQVPIMEFSWSVFKSMQGANGDGGGTQQVPNIPILRYISETTSF